MYMRNQTCKVGCYYSFLNLSIYLGLKTETMLVPACYLSCYLACIICHDILHVLQESK